MANTNIFTKKSFIEWFKINIKDDDVVILSNSVNGTLSVTKSKGLHLPFSFDPNVYIESKKQGVGHIAKGETFAAAFLISSPDIVSEEAKSKIITTLKNQHK